MVTNFGDVPLILSPVTSLQEAFSVAVRADKATVYNQIKEDLEKAKSLLPNSKYSSDNEKWRVSKGSTIALQAKVALYNQEWNNVITFVNELENLGYYNLNNNYFQSFTAEYNDNEVIFSYDHQSAQNPTKGNGLCAPIGWGFFAPSTDFLNAFKANDPRKLYTVDTANQNVNKLLGSLNGENKGNDDASNNKIYIRYADVLLWKAEALIETNNLNGAVDVINQIRTRARSTITATGDYAPTGTLPNKVYSTDNNTVKNWLISERRVELGFESHRLLDLKRWGIAKTVLNNAGINFQEKHMLYPIPQSELDASAGTLTQNSGY